MTKIKMPDNMDDLNGVLEFDIKPYEIEPLITRGLLFGGPVPIVPIAYSDDLFNYNIDSKRTFLKVCDKHQITYDEGYKAIQLAFYEILTKHSSDLTISFSDDDTCDCCNVFSVGC